MGHDDETNETILMERSHDGTTSLGYFTPLITHYQAFES
jgi:hypothetical protein